VSLCASQFFFLGQSISFLVALSLHAALSPGQIYEFNFTDVDGHTFSTADGHVTVLVLAATEDLLRVRAVGDRVPDYCLGNPSYRMITVLNLTKKNTRIGRGIATMLVRHRLDEEAKRLQARYDAKKIARDARRDAFAVADFDGSIVSKLGGESATFRVFAFGKNGELLRQWDDIPAADDLAAVLK
jgi:hypothetical protein